MSTLAVMSAGVDPRTGLEHLDHDECMRLLGRCSLGRLAVVVGRHPVIFPVNFALDGGSIVFRTNEGTKLYAARQDLVAFECDGVDRTYHTGWSVLVTGNAEEVRRPEEIEQLSQLHLGLWTTGPKPIWLRIRPRTITGRRIPAHGSVRVDAAGRRDPGT